MLNKIILMGRLTRDPELQQTQSGTKVASFALAVDRDFAGQDGKRETDFIDCVAWRGTGESAAEDFTKGQMAAEVAVERDWIRVEDRLPEGMETADYMRICTAMLDSADAIGLLRDWADSPGAKCEMALAQYLGKRIIHVDMIQGPVRRAENG